MGPDFGPNSLIFLFFNRFFESDKATENRIPNLGKLERWDYLNMLSPFWDPTRKFDFPQCQLQDKYRTPVISTQIWNTIHFGAELTNTGFYPRQMLNSDLTNTDNSGWTNTDNCPQNPITVPKPLPLAHCTILRRNL